MLLLSIKADRGPPSQPISNRSRKNSLGVSPCGPPQELSYWQADMVPKSRRKGSGIISSQHLLYKPKSPSSRLLQTGNQVGARRGRVPGADPWGNSAETFSAVKSAHLHMCAFFPEV